MSLTKEEIIHQYYENGGYDGGYSENDVEKMMQEYALQEMGKFAEWTSINNWRVGGDDNWYSLDEGNHNEYTTSELIQRYINRDK